MPVTLVAQFSTTGIFVNGKSGPKTIYNPCKNYFTSYNIPKSTHLTF